MPTKVTGTTETTRTTDQALVTSRIGKAILSGVIVCQCKVVSDRQIDEAISAGARSVSAVCRATGAARDCGTCIFTVKALVCEHQSAEQVLMEVKGAAS